jgi:hypothetical protein
MIRAGFEIANRRPMPPVGALYLMQSRTRSLKVSAPKQRVEVSMDTDACGQIPQPVKIIHAG